MLSLPGNTGGWTMAKIKVSASDLTWIFSERLRTFAVRATTVSIAIVPTKDGWRALVNAHTRSAFPDCVRRVEQIERHLRKIYVLTED